MCRRVRYAVSGLVLLAPLLSLAQSDPSDYPKCPVPQETCVVYGVDFQNGGSYFQDKNSTAHFSFVQDFEGCDMDIAYNMLVGPNGDQTLCSSSNLTPADVDMTSTCPNYKSALSNGLWTILVISNNGNCAPIAYQRDFTLTVADQQTYTYTPTITFTNTITPVAYLNTTSIITVTSTAPVPYTTTVPATFRSQTRTITPHPVTTTVTSVQKLVPVTKWTWTVSPNMVTITASCTITPRATRPDPYLTIIPTLTAVEPLAQSILHGPAAPIVSAKGGLMGDIESQGTQFFEAHGGRGWSAREKREFLEQREARFANRLHKRAPDSATVTVTQMNPSLFVTSSTAVTVSGVVMSTEVDITSTLYTTPAPATVYTGVSVHRTYTTEIPVTITRIRNVPATIAWTWGTKTLRPTIQVTTTPAAVASECARRGGHLRSEWDAQWSWT